MKLERRRTALWFAAYMMLVGICAGSLLSAGDITLGRNPWRNLKKTIAEMSEPSFLKVWFGETNFEFKNDEGEVLRRENQQETESLFLTGLVRAIWTTIKIATLGSFLACLLAFPIGVLTAKNINCPRVVKYISKLLLDSSRSIHTLIFGLLFVGIFGLGPMAGILAIAAHSMGTYGKLYAESIETIDMGSIDAVRAVGASETQIFFNAFWPAFLPQFVSTHLYVWEYNIRDSTILGLVGAGGLGLLVSEAIALFQWSRLATILLAIILVVFIFDAFSRRLRTSLL